MNESTHQKELFGLLDKLGIHYTNYAHEPLFTVERAKTAAAHIPAAWVKNLFLKDSKKQLYLVVALADTKISLKELGKKLGAPELRFADAELLKQYLGVEPGSVTPFGLMLDTDQSVVVILDKSLFEKEAVGVHPLANNATTVISPQDLKKFVVVCGNPLVEINFHE